MSAVLLLNADYSPIRSLSLERAVNLIIGERAELIEQDGDKVLRSPSVTFPRPCVIRLHRYVRVPRRGMTWTRRAVLARDNYHCGYCNSQLDRRSTESTIDHIIPKSRGGKSVWTNTVSCCKKCQRVKGDRLLQDTKLKLLVNPVTPRGDYLVVASDYPAIWKRYIRTG